MILNTHIQKNYRVLIKNLIHHHDMTQGVHVNKHTKKHTHRHTDKNNGWQASKPSNLS